jgi:small GTP-binding protein
MALPRIVLLGSIAPGKTQMIFNLFGKGRAPLRGTPVAEWIPVDIQVDGKPTRIEVWDTPARGRTSKVEAAWAQHATGVLLLFDPSWRFSFEGVDWWRDEVAAAQRLAGRRIPVLLLGNKCDAFMAEQPQNWELVRARYEAYAAENGFVAFMPTCALDGTNVARAFETIVKACQAG